MTIEAQKEIAGRFSYLTLNQIKPRGWILEQMRGDLADGFAPILDELTIHAATDLFKQRIDNNSEHMQWWDSETRGNWLLGYVHMAYLADDPLHKQRIDELVQALMATQDDDGYIGIYTPDSRYNHAPGENGELWSQGRALLILLSYYELTGDQSALRAAERSAQLTITQYGPGRPYFVVEGTENGFSLGGLLHGLTYVDAMEWLYTLTGDVTYRDFGVWLYDDFCQLPGKFTHDDMKLSLLLDADEALRGHAAHPAEHLRTVIYSYFMTGRPELKQGIDNAFAKLARYIVPSGALIGDESIHGLPYPEMGYEYCTMFELMNSISNAAQKFGRVEYGDWIENITFNAAQGARFTDGKAICYLSAENRLRALDVMPDTYSNHRYQFDPTLKEIWQGNPHQDWQRGGRFKFSPTHEDVAVCCNPNAVRLMPHYTSKLWLRVNDSSDLVAFMYGPSLLETVVNGVPVAIVQDTHYP
ncbi:MAG: glycoside hydrolase family 127 protein, partial [Candidatus Promineifilaceae bacterium]|nr:glycoside hydrolase family 127 protein [Candidatus Promineifilaceae bacterium]